MPLLRQSLYSQNVNLYLAPTADARDTWVSLMRTVASEGRCVVLSSNQCMKKADIPSWITGKKEEGDDMIGFSKLRRASTVTADGHEIALPYPKKGAEDSQINGHGAKLRRKSTVTEDGHQIALPGKEEVKEAVQSEPSDFICRGGSCIISPLGDVIAGPLWDDDDGLLTVDVDFEDCLRGRLDLDVAGSYSR